MSLVFTLTPPAAFINANDRTHHHPKAKLTAAWRGLARFHCEHAFADVTFDRAHIVIAYRFPNNRRRETANLQPTSKALVDGIVDAGLLPDDDDRHCVGPDNRREWPNGPARVTVTITPLEELS